MPFINANQRRKQSVTNTFTVDSLRSALSCTLLSCLFKKTRFLGELPEVSWYYIDNYTIYIAFGRSVSGDNKLTCHSAALQGDLAVGGWGVRVYALNADEYPSFQSLPRDFIPFYRVSYKNGELQKE